MEKIFKNGLLLNKIVLQKSKGNENQINLSETEVKQMRKIHKEFTGETESDIQKILKDIKKWIPSQILEDFSDTGQGLGHVVRLFTVISSALVNPQAVGRDS